MVLLSKTERAIQRTIFFKILLERWQKKKCSLSYDGGILFEDWTVLQSRLATLIFAYFHCLGNYRLENCVITYLLKDLDLLSLSFHCLKELYIDIQSLIYLLLLVK